MGNTTLIFSLGHSSEPMASFPPRFPETQAVFIIGWVDNLELVVEIKRALSGHHFSRTSLRTQVLIKKTRFCLFLFSSLIFEND